MLAWLPSALAGLLPVLAFLAALLLLDGYKLVRLRLVVGVAAVGVLAAGASYLLNGHLLASTGIELRTYSRYVAPVTEELLKALVVVALVRTHRVGFLVDGAILGFAAGAGFAIVENLYYLHQAPDAGLGTWIVRGFGTAIMHGGATAIFAVMALARLDRPGARRGFTYLPGFAAAVALHSAFNHFVLPPIFTTLGILVTLPPLFAAVFRHSERSLRQWLGAGFDADAQMLQLIQSGALPDSPVGAYLRSLRERFQGPVVADLLCYLRLHTELALRAKGILLMRENGFEVPIDEATRTSFTEMRYLEKSVGRTGLLALHPLLRMSHKDLWQLYMLGK